MIVVRVGRRSFPPIDRAIVKAVACELPATKGLPLSRFSVSEIARHLSAEGLLAVSPSTVQRWLQNDALRPWTYRSWVFRRDPNFLAKASVVLDLYHRIWEGKPLGPDEYVICADEKTGIQALGRSTPTRAPQPGHPGLVEQEYIRGGTVVYLTALDVGTGKVTGRVEDKNGKDPFMRLVDDVMVQEPYRSAKRVFWIVDNGSAHHPEFFGYRLMQRHPNAVAVHMPIHASWLNQNELYFSIVQRKALTPNDLPTPEAVRIRLLEFQGHYNLNARPFTWRFTRQDMETRMNQVA
jgi:hypothetical protein